MWWGGGGAVGPAESENVFRMMSVKKYKSKEIKFLWRKLLLQRT